MRFQTTASLAAGASVANVLSGTQLELINKASLAKFGIVARAAAHFASKYPVNTNDGVRMNFPDG